MYSETVDLLPEGGDQRMEYEMLSCMYPELVGPVEVTTGTDWGTHGPFMYRIQIPNESEINDSTGAPHNEIDMRLILPEGYPDEGKMPVILLESISTVRRVQCEPLRKELVTVAEENAGMASITNLFEHAKEWLSSLKSREEQAKSQATEKSWEAEKAKGPGVVADPTIRMGRMVTSELFYEWLEEFKAEKAALREKELKKLKKHKEESKLTGKQMWDQSIKQTDWSLFKGDKDTDKEGGAAVEDDEEEDIDFDMYDVDEEEEEEHGYDVPERETTEA